MTARRFGGERSSFFVRPWTEIQALVWSVSPLSYPATVIWMLDPFRATASSSAELMRAADFESNTTSWPHWTSRCNSPQISSTVRETDFPSFRKVQYRAGSSVEPSDARLHSQLPFFNRGARHTETVLPPTVFALCPVHIPSVVLIQPKAAAAKDRTRRLFG